MIHRIAHWLGWWSGKVGHHDPPSDWPALGISNGHVCLRCPTCGRWECE